MTGITPVKIASPDPTCRICGRELERCMGRGRPREYHSSCKNFTDWLARAEEAVHRIRWADDPHYALLTRRRLQNIINSLPISRHAQRDEKGRFA